MTGLLVSVRDAQEAEAALRGGASLIDVKEPLHGSLGAALPEVWREIRAAVPRDITCSAALGELPDISPQQQTPHQYQAMATTVSARLGEWFEVGGAVEDTRSPGSRRIESRRISSIRDPCAE